MRKQLFAAIMLLFTLSAMAQEGSQNVGIQLGWSNAALRERIPGREKLSSTQLYGAKFGLVYETTFIKGLGMQMGLNYTYGGHISKWQKDPMSTIRKTRSIWNYNEIEIPIDWQYKFTIAKQTYLLLYTGPTLQLGISMTKNEQVQDIAGLGGTPTTTNYRTNLYTTDLDADGDGKYDRFNRLNITWGVGAGFQYKQYYLRGGYDFGIMPIYHDTYNNLTSTYNQGRLDQWSIKLGIYLWQF